MAATTVPALKLNNGVEMPALGLGVFQTPARARRATPSEPRWAPATGTSTPPPPTATSARSARRSRASGLDRSEVFIETKIWISDYGYDETLHGFEKSAGKLGVEQIDLLILHQALPSALRPHPGGLPRPGDAAGRRQGPRDRRQQLHGRPPAAAARDAPRSSRPSTRSSSTRTSRRPTSRRSASEHGILAQAWSPIGGITFYRDSGHTSTLEDPVIGEIAEAHGKSPAQVMLRWGLQHGRSVIPKSTKPRPHRREPRRLRLRALRRRDGRDRRPGHRPPRRAGARGHHARGLRHGDPGGLTHGLPPARTHRRPGLPAVPRHDDVRRLGQHRPRRLDPHHPPRARRRRQLRRHRRRLLGRRVRGDRRQGARRRRRDDVVLATKFFMPMGEDPNQRGGSRRWIVRAVEDSLRRLGTDYIDLYQVHRPDPDIDVEETLGALTDLVRQGKVRYIGSSSYSGSQIVEAQWTARERRPGALPHRAAALLAADRGSSSSTSCRPRSATAWASSPTARWPAAGCRAATARTPTPVRPPAPARSALAARFDMSLPENQRKLDAVEQLAQVAEDAGLTLIELAIAFVINHPGVTSAIIGPRTMEQLDSQLPAADVVARRRRRSTASTRSSSPASSSTPPTPATASRSSSRRCAAARTKEPSCRSPAAASTRRRGPPTGSPATSTSTPSPRRPAARPSRPPPCTSRPAPAPPGTPTRTARRSSSPRASGAASARAGRSRSIRPGDRVFFEPGENHWHGAAPEPLHGPHRHAPERRDRQPGHLGRARQRRAVRRGALALTQTGRLRACAWRRQSHRATERSLVVLVVRFCAVAPLGKCLVSRHVEP